MNDCRRVFHLIEDERHLSAHKLYLSIIERLEHHPSKTHSSPSKHVHNPIRRKKPKKAADEEYQMITEYLDARKDQLTTLEVGTGIL
jgi:hypothetical protein